MIDRRIISYETGIEKLGFDFKNELANMVQEAPMVQAGLLGIIGSPYNPKVVAPAEHPDSDSTREGVPVTTKEEDLTDFQKNIQNQIDALQEHIQKIQRTPKGTPSEGRPRRGRGKPRQKSTQPNIKPPKPTNNN